MVAEVIRLFRQRTFTAPTEGKQNFCANCTQELHAHPKVPCSGCGRSFRACLLGGKKSAWANCHEHGEAL